MSTTEEVILTPQPDGESHGGIADILTSLRAAFKVQAAREAAVQQERDTLVEALRELAEAMGYTLMETGEEGFPEIQVTPVAPSTAPPAPLWTEGPPRRRRGRPKGATAKSAPLACDICSRTFSSPGHLARHSTVHRKNRQ